MLLYWCSWTYLFTMTAVAVLLVWLLRWMLKRLRSVRQQPMDGRTYPVWLKPMFAAWTVFSLMYLLELGFAATVDTTDAFNATNVSARWFQRHVEPYRNAEGFRDRRNFPRGQSDSRSRIFMIGDSFTIAQGINRMEDRFTDLCEVALNQRRKDQQKEVEVYNLGEFGWEVSVIAGLVEGTFRQGYRPDLFVYVYMMNDIEGYDPRTEASIKKIQQKQPTFFLWTDTYFFNWMNFLWRQKQAQRTVQYFPHLADSYREQPWAGVEFEIQKMKAQCEQHGAEFRMVLFPFLHNLGPDYEFLHAHRKLVGYCSEQGIPCLDLEPILTPHASEGLTVNRYDNHPNERCHAIVADAISDTLLHDFPRSTVRPADGESNE